MAFDISVPNMSTDRKIPTARDMRERWRLCVFVGSGDERLLLFRKLDRKERITEVCSSCPLSALCSMRLPS